jgi:hypothetical protein
LNGNAIKDLSSPFSSLSMMIADTQFFLFPALELILFVFAFWALGLGKRVS